MRSISPCIGCSKNDTRLKITHSEHTCLHKVNRLSTQKLTNIIPFTHVQGLPTKIVKDILPFTDFFTDNEWKLFDHSPEIIIQDLEDEIIDRILKNTISHVEHKRLRNVL